MTQQTIVLVTGSKSGIGKGLLATYASRPNTVAIAAIRDGPDSAPAKELTSLPVGKDSKVVVAKYDASSETAGADLAAYLQSTLQIKHLDVVVANAGILKHFGPVKEAKSAELFEHFQINTVAPILLYQATASLLNASEKEPKFFTISSALGSNALLDTYPLPMIAYGISKAGANFFSGRLHREEDRIVVVAAHPGWVQTTMGEQAATWVGMSPNEVPVKLEDSVSGLIKVFDSATKAEHSGKFLDFEGNVVPF